MAILKNEKGFTLVEAVIALAVAVVLFGSLVLTFVAVKSMNKMARHHIQAMQVVRGQIDQLKVIPLSQVLDSTTTVSYDAGPDGIFNTADDVKGTLTVKVQDFLDMDSDNNTTETLIDVDGDGVNDATAKPVRVTFTWSEYVLGRQKNFSVFADTLIAG